MAVRKIVDPEGRVSYRRDPTGEEGDSGGAASEDDYINEKAQERVKSMSMAPVQMNPAEMAKRQGELFGPKTMAPKLQAQKISIGPMAQMDPNLIAQREKFAQTRRDELSRNFNAQSGQAQDALNRRFSAMGMSGSGAALKTGLQAQQEIEQSKQDAQNKLSEQELGQQMQLEQADLARRDAFDQRRTAADQFNAEVDMKTQLGNIEIENKYRDRDMAEKQFLLDADTTEFNKRIAEIEARKPSGGGGGGGCCFIFLEARYGNGTMDSVVRRYRDEHITERSRRGYCKLSEVLVPAMRRSSVIKFLVRICLTDPLVSFGRYHYGESRMGWIFKPVVNFWLKTFEYLGQDHKYIRENGEVI